MREGGRRRTPTQRLVAVRRWLLSGFALLALVLAALVGYEHHRARRLLAELPHRLGLDIQSETNGFTYTQSVKGRVLFTVHAAKAIQRENGKTTLHDVSIAVHPTLGSNKPDTIRGEQFEYDQPNGVIRAVGVVHLDLAAPRSRSADPHTDAARIAVTTSGLVFLQKLGVLATDEPLQIVYGDMHGSARGADYETDTGMLHLRSDVQLVGMQDGKPVHVVAAEADFDRTRQAATLRSAQVQVAGDRARGDHMVLTAANGGGPRMLDADGHVTVDAEGGEHLSANRAQANMDQAGHLQQVAARGDVQLQDERYRATAGSALLHMDAAGRPRQAELTTAVHVSLAGKAGQASSELTAPHAVFNLVESGSHTELKDLFADGGAVLSSAEAASTAQSAGHVQPLEAKASRVSTLTASSLHATTAVADGTRYISAVEGQGGTRLEQSDSVGNRRVSSGDTLQAVLLPSAPPATPSRTQALLRSVVQTGHVDVSQHKILPSAPGSHAVASRVEDDHATAQRAEWDNASEQLHLTGSPVLTGPGVQLAADTIDLAQKNSSTAAVGHVRGLLEKLGTGDSEPVHVLAERCRIDSGTGAAVFFGETAPVRLWTSTAQLEAAQVDVKKAEGVLIAHSAVQASQSDVRLVLNDTSNSPANKSKQRSAVLVHGQQMTITAASGQTATRIETTGEVRMSAAGSDVRADRVVALMNPAHAPGAQPTAGPALLPGSGSLQSIVATGNVKLQQPGRSARGQELLYTAKEDQYRLSGQQDKPAFLHDSLRGDVTGASLIFHGSDERAEVAGETSHPVRTELPAPAGRSH